MEGLREGLRGLVLRRRVGEVIWITVPTAGDPVRIRVEITDVGAGQARLAIKAPGDVQIHRQEIQEALR